MSITRKTSMQENVFDGISAVYAVSGGFTSQTAGSYDLDGAVELPVSESGGVNINGGTPSTTQFRVHGLTAPWTSHMTPGDVELTLEVPTNDEAVLNIVYGGASSTNVNVDNIPSGSSSKKLYGKGFGWPQKSVNLGLLIVNDTEDKALFIKKAKLLASPQFNGEDKPFVVTLTGTVASAADAESLAILDSTTAPS